MPGDTRIFTRRFADGAGTLNTALAKQASVVATTTMKSVRRGVDALGISHVRPAARRLTCARTALAGVTAPALATVAAVGGEWITTFATSTTVGWVEFKVGAVVRVRRSARGTTEVAVVAGAALDDITAAAHAELTAVPASLCDTITPTPTAVERVGPNVDAHRPVADKAAGFRCLAVRGADLPAIAADVLGGIFDGHIRLGGVSAPTINRCVVAAAPGEQSQKAEQNRGA